ncbi:DUF3347 domain-containing protein [Aquimarina aquimarini]|uniref:DUF3347 domain-containing protein n=1 Tax=Aquimarina aquimarini TaxID=1191734 RepID=UPI000D54B8E1|nr:DUF3347 domain-containing protein [Aquimarina aquimarini]
MRISKINLILIATIIFTTISCKQGNTTIDNEKEQHSEIKNDSEMPNKNQETEVVKNVKFNNATADAIFQHYIHIKTALVNTDVNEAKQGADMLAEATENTVLKKVAKTISDNVDVEKQRIAFVDLTARVEKILKGNVSSGEIYKQYCPMAFDNTGAYWLSKEKEIRNPYFGDRMLKCGSITETIQ